MAELDTLARVEAALDDNQSFLLEAGAGSGKTTALVHGIRHLLSTRRPQLMQTRRRIACITYTNVAKRQISERIADDPLVYVGTIHEFLWDVIQGFQKQLRIELLAHNETLRNPTPDLKDTLTPDTKITYSDRGRKFSEGRISHDDVLALAYQMVSTYPRLARIIADRFPVIFVDEYQDTSPTTVKILLDHLADIRGQACLIGLFGDSMQKIYGTGVGKVEDHRLKRITKLENYRCSQPVISLLNKIRPGLQQHLAGTPRDGKVFLFLNHAIPNAADRLTAARSALQAEGWTDQDTKYLQLTHRGIAGTLDYSELLATYDARGSFGRDDLLDASEPYAQYTRDIEQVARAYGDQNFGETTRLLGLAGARLTRHSQKATMATTLRELLQMRGTGTIGEVVDFVADQQLLQKPAKVRAVERSLHRDGLDESLQKRVDFARRLRSVAYREMISVCHFREERTPFSTQHGVKGDEFPNVVVLVEDGAWTQFSIGKMMAGSDKPERAERSRNLFYVCCSRPVNNLAVVFLSDLPVEAAETALTWFAQATIIP